MIPCPDTDAIKSYTDRSAARRESPQRFAIASMQFRHVVAARVSYPEVGSVKSNELRLRPNRESPGYLAIAGAKPDYCVAAEVSDPYG